MDLRRFDVSFINISFVDKNTLFYYSFLSVWDLEHPISNCDFDHYYEKYEYVIRIVVLTIHAIHEVVLQAQTQII